MLVVNLSKNHNVDYLSKQVLILGLHQQLFHLKLSAMTENVLQQQDKYSITRY